MWLELAADLDGPGAVAVNYSWPCPAGGPESSEGAAGGEERVTVLRRIADLCLAQRDFHLAAKKYTQACVCGGGGGGGGDNSPLTD